MVLNKNQYVINDEFGHLIYYIKEGQDEELAYDSVEDIPDEIINCGVEGKLIKIVGVPHIYTKNGWKFSLYNEKLVKKLIRNKKIDSIT